LQGRRVVEDKDDRMVGGEDFGGSNTMEKKENGEDDCKGFRDFTKLPYFMDEMSKLPTVLYLCPILCVHLSFLFFFYISILH